MKYIKPNSLAWWASLAPLLAGLVIAGADVLPILAPAAAFAHNVFGFDKTAAQLVQLGLLGIGIRGAIS